MMPDFKKRQCPACGNSASTQEVSSAARAETMTPEALRPFWSGLFKQKIFFTYDRCETCDLLYAPDFFDSAQLESLYSQMAPNMDIVPTDALKATQRGYYDCAATQETEPGGYLEIGPDIGYLVSEAAGNGAFDAFWLFEPNLAMHDALRRAAGTKPATLLSDMTDLSAVPDGSITLAVMIHVLDHLLDPMSMLTQIRSKLRPGGKLLIVTHNEASLLRHIMGRRWPPFCLQHPQLYNPAQMKRILDRAGFSHTEVKRSTNYFPIAFMIRQAAWTIGLRLDRIPLPRFSIGLKLGNIVSIATR